MAEEVYNRMAIYARVKYGIAQPKVGWQVIKQELETLMRTTINTTLSPEDQAKFKAGGIEGLALHKRDQSMRIDAWKEAIHNRFKVGVGYFAVPPDVRWLTAFEEAERLVKPRKGFIQEFKDAQTFVTWYNEAYKRFKLREPIVGDKDWFRLLKNVSAAVISGD
jgi:hypothetical protein